MIDFGKYTRNIRNLFNSLYDVKVEFHNSEDTLYRSDKYCKYAVEREYRSYLKYMISNNKLDYNSINNLFNILYNQWVSQLYITNNEFKNDDSKKCLSDNAFNIVKDVYNNTSNGSKKILSAIPIYTFDNNELYDLTIVGDTEESIIKYFIACLTKSSENKIIIIKYVPNPSEEVMKEVRHNNIRSRLSSIIDLCKSDEDIEFAIKELRSKATEKLRAK